MKYTNAKKYISILSCSVLFTISGLAQMVSPPIFKLQIKENNNKLILEKADSEGIQTGFTLANKETALVKFTGLNASITTKRLINPGRIQVSHLIARKGDDLVFSIYYSKDKKDWRRIKTLPEGLSHRTEINKDTLLTDKSYSLDLVGDYYIKFTVEKYNSGSLLVEDLKIFETDAEIIKKRRQEAQRIKELEMQRELIKSELTRDETIATAKLLKKEYLHQIDNYELLLNKTGDLEVLYSLTLFMYKRTKMVSADEYTDFNKTISGLKERADELDKILISQLQESLKAPEVPSQPKNISGILRLGYNLGNIISGGKLESIINSFKGIFSRTYSMTNLIINDMQNPTLPSVFHEVPKKGGEIVINADRVREIKAVSANGIEDFKKLSTFFNIIQDEHKHLQELIKKLETGNLGIEQFRDLLNENIKTTFGAVDYNISDYAINELQIADRELKENLKAEIRQYFDPLIIIDIQEFKKKKDYIKSKLENANIKLLSFDNILNKYYSQVEDLSNISTGFIDDLKRENPFGKDKATFQQSFEEWEKYKLEAQGKINNLPDNIIEQYSTYVKNKIK